MVAKSHTEIALQQIRSEQGRNRDKEKPDTDSISNIMATVNAKIVHKGGEPIDQKKKFTVPRIAEKLRVSERTVRRLLQRLKEENKTKASIEKAAFVQRRAKKPEDTSPWSGIAQNRGGELANRIADIMSRLRKEQRTSEEVA